MPRIIDTDHIEPIHDVFEPEYLEHYDELEPYFKRTQNAYSNIVVQNKHVSYKMWYYIKRDYTKKDGTENTYYTTKVEYRSINITNQRQLMEEILDDTELYLVSIGQAGEYYSHLMGISNIRVHKIKDIKKKNIKLKEANKMNLFNFDNIFDTKNGECVIDYLHFELSQHERHKKYHHRDTIKKYFEKNICDISGGITLAEMIQFVCHIKDANLVVFDMMMNRDENNCYYTDINDKMSFYCVINNDHIYPIPKDLRGKASRTSKNLLDKTVFNNTFNDYDFYNNDNHDKLIDGTYTTKQILLIDSDNLISLCHEIYLKKNIAIVDLKINHNKIIKFIHPLTSKLYISSPDYKNRLKICNDMREKNNCDEFIFNDQSWGTLGSLHFKITQGYMIESSYSPDLLRAFEFTGAKQIICSNVKNDDVMLFDNIKSIDITGSYRSYIINNKYDYPVFSVMDTLQIYKGEDIEAGIYCLKNDKKIFDNIPLKGGHFYYHNLISYLLEINEISKKDISYKIKAMTTIKHDVFKSWALDIIDTYDNSKDIINHFIGTLGMNTDRETYGGFTDSYDIAQSQYNDEKNKNRKVSIINVGDLYFITSSKNSVRLSGHKPINEFIICGGIINLCEMHRKIVTKDSIVLSIKVDNIKGINLDMTHVKKIKEMGSYYQDNTNVISGRYIETILQNTVFSHIEKKYNMINENQSFLYKNSCIVGGIGGCGKSELLKNVYNVNDGLVLTFTNAGCENLKNRGVDCMTFDSFIEQKLDIAQYKFIYVDEFSQVSKYHYSILHKAKRNGAQIQLYGDFNQCKPVDNISYDYRENDYIKYLVDGNKMILNYKVETGRYDEDLHQVIKYFLINNNVEKARPITDVLLSNIVMTNDQKDQINKLCYEKYKDDDELDLNGFKIFRGCRLMYISHDKIKDDDKEFINSKRFIVDDWDEENIYLECMGDIKVYSFKIKDFNKTNFVYGWAFTIYKIQGIKIDEPFNIYNMYKDKNGRSKHMSANEFYTSLSRGTKEKDVHYKIFINDNYSKFQYRWDKPSTQKKELLLTERKAGNYSLYEVIFKDDTKYINYCKTYDDKWITNHATNKFKKDVKSVQLIKNYNNLTEDTMKIIVERNKIDCINTKVGERVEVVIKKLDDSIQVLEMKCDFVIKYRENCTNQIKKIKKTIDRNDDIKCVNYHLKKICDEKNFIYKEFI